MGGPNFMRTVPDGANTGQAEMWHLELFREMALVVLPVFVGLAFYVLYQTTFHPLARIPGPFFAKITQLWMLRKTLNGAWHREIIDLHEKYGDYVRIGPNEVSTIGENAVPLIYNQTGKTWAVGAKTRAKLPSGASAALSVLAITWAKTPWYRTWYPNGDFSHPVFAETEPLKHRDLRRRVAKAYSMSYIHGMERYVDGIVDVLATKMKERSGQVVNFTTWSQYFSFDVIGELAVGKSFNFLETGDNIGFTEAVFKHMFCVGAAGWLPGQYRALYWWPARWLMNNSILKGSGVQVSRLPQEDLMEIVTSKVSFAPDRQTDRADMLSHFMATKNADGTQISPQDAFAEAMNTVVAGADTTAISIRAILRYASANPRVYRRLKAEIVEADKAGRLSDIVQFKEAAGLPYFQACIKEGLRLHPAVGYNLPRVVPQGGVAIDDLFLPQGVEIGINAWALHRNPKIFGDRPDEFRPERWLDERSKGMESLFGSFGFGSRTCIGKNIGLLEINKLIPQLLRELDFEVVKAEEPWSITTSWLAYSSGLDLRISTPSE